MIDTYLTALAVARRALSIEREALAQLDINVLPLEEAFIHVMRRDSQAKIVTTGIGKVGFVAQRLAATLSSVGLPAVFLHPADAQHGDLGALQFGDVLIACSNSGQTREVLETVTHAAPFLQRGYIAITGKADSPLAEQAQVALVYGAVKEACPLGLVPTSSILVMSVICDVLVAGLMSLTGVTAETFYRRHHGGYLGEQGRALR